MCSDYSHPLAPRVLERWLLSDYNQQPVSNRKTPMKHAMTARWSDDLRAALLSEATINGPYTMSLSGDSIEAVQKAVNQGIDGHLEACFLPSRGDSYEPNTTRFGQTLQYAVQRLDCVVSPESLVCLVRRLMESEDDEANNLASGICETLEIELI